MKPNSFELLLASESPRRKQLLAEAGFQFTVFPVKVSENLEKNLNLDAGIQQIAERKAQKALETYNPLKTKDFLVLAADTLVIFNQQVLGKPQNEQEAEQFLSLLSGHKHQVKTAVCLISSSTKKILNRIESTAVYFRPISRQEIVDYIQSGEPMDKAGAYAIQGLGRTFVTQIEGNLDNVIGLPVGLVREMIEEMFEK